MSKRAHFARQLQQGAYHRHIFAQETRTQEVIIVRNGVTTGAAAPKADLGTNLGGLLDAALRR